MPNYVISPPQITGLPIDGTDALFPVRRVYCIGRNYAAHAIEMGHDPDREPPFFFQKNPKRSIQANICFPLKYRLPVPNTDWRRFLPRWQQQSPLFF
mgnify:CR=1 FL=1